MKVMLISANTERINMPVLPLGLGYVAAAAGNAGHEVCRIDLMTRDDLNLERALKDFDPEVIGISIRNIDDQARNETRFLLTPVRETAALIRKISDAPIVLGGPGYSIFPRSALSFVGADMGIQGEGEVAFPLLLEFLSEKKDPACIPGIHLLKETSCIRKPSFRKNLDEFSIPLPHIDMDMPCGKEKNETWVPFQTRRGCPMKCSYCSTGAIEGTIIRKMNPQKAVEGIKKYVDAGFHRFFFVDNTFNFPVSYAEELCDRITSEGLDIQWRSILYPYRIPFRLVKKMAKAGCVEISLGCESGSRDILLKMGKAFDPEEVRRIARDLEENGIRRMGFLLLGAPGETRQTMTESFDFAEALDLESMKITCGIRIYPGTRLHRLAIRQGMLKPDEDLLRPKFYMEPGIEEDLGKMMESRMKDRPNWIR